MKPAAEKCHVPGCTLFIQCSGMCQRHYNRYWYEKRVKGNEPTLEELGAMKIRHVPRLSGKGGGTNHTQHQPLGVPMNQFPVGQIITDEDVQSQEIPLDSGGVRTAPARKYPARRDKSYRRKVLHEGITATLQVLATFYNELKELDDE